MWWRDVVTPFLGKEDQAAKLGSWGRQWMGSTLTLLAELFDGQNRLAEAREARRLLVEKDLPGKEDAKLSCGARGARRATHEAVFRSR